MPGTRESVVFKCMAWAKDDLTRIFWLAGMAGTGKTSIAVTLCRMLRDEPHVVLGGSFFCSRFSGSVPRTEARRILPTLVLSLVDRYPEFAKALLEELKANPQAAHKPARQQIEALLIKPSASLASYAYPIVFVIDALDECSDGREIASLISAIADFESDVKFKFILTSRPEMHIRGTPISNPAHYSVLHLHTIGEVEVTADIRRYITGTLNAVDSDTDWYTNEDLESLVDISRGLFIFASTVLRYIQARVHAKGRKERLQKVTSAASGTTAATISLDKIYEMILLEAARSDAVDVDELDETKRVLACILTARTSLSAQALAELLDVEVDDVRGSLERLHSVVYMPADDEDSGLRVLHASFGDYILSRAASHIRIDAILGDNILAKGCLHVMAKRLHFNISQSLTSYKENAATRPDSITISLEYACLQWVHHLGTMAVPSTLDNELITCFCPRLLFWLEVISILGRVGPAAAMLKLAASMVCRTAYMGLTSLMTSNGRFSLPSFPYSFAMPIASSRHPGRRLSGAHRTSIYLPCPLQPRTRSYTRPLPRIALVSYLSTHLASIVTVETAA